MRFLICLVIHVLYKVVRRYWFFFTRRDAEIAHEHGMAILRFIGRRPWLVRSLQWLTAVKDPRLHCKLGGVVCDNPVWLAAGFCKYADAALVGLSALGFGGIVLGSITREESPGNPRPRLFRDGTGNLLNRMRFNNDGAVVTGQKVRALLPLPVPLAVSISKSVSVDATDVVMVIDDVCRTLTTLYRMADVIEVNLSSPNSQGLRNWQQREYLAQILSTIVSLGNKLARTATRAKRKPIYVKLDPDMLEAEFDEAVDVCIEAGVDGIILTNTTKDRHGLPEAWAGEAGGVSGTYLFPKALARLQRAALRAKQQLAVIGVGGIASAEDAWQMLRAGADAIQLLTALPYEGPLVPYFIKRGLARRLRRAGIDCVGAVRYLVDT